MYLYFSWLGRCYEAKFVIYPPCILQCSFLILKIPFRFEYHALKSHFLHLDLFALVVTAEELPLEATWQVLNILSKTFPLNWTSKLYLNLELRYGHLKFGVCYSPPPHTHTFLKMGSFCLFTLLPLLFSKAKIEQRVMTVTIIIYNTASEKLDLGLVLKVRGCTMIIIQQSCWKHSRMSSFYPNFLPNASLILIFMWPCCMEIATVSPCHIRISQTWSK